MQSEGARWEGELFTPPAALTRHAFHGTQPPAGSSLGVPTRLPEDEAKRIHIAGLGVPLLSNDLHGSITQHGIGTGPVARVAEAVPTQSNG